MNLYIYIFNYYIYIWVGSLYSSITRWDMFIHFMFTMIWSIHMRNGGHKVGDSIYIRLPIQIRLLWIQILLFRYNNWKWTLKVGLCCQNWDYLRNWHFLKFCSFHLRIFKYIFQLLLLYSCTECVAVSNCLPLL